MGYRLKVDNLHRELGLFTGLIFFTKTDTDILETRYLFSLSFSFKNATFGGGNDPVCPNCNCLCRLSTLRFSGGPATWGQDCLLCTGGQPVYNVGVSRMFQCVADVVVWSILNLASSTQASAASSEVLRCKLSGVYLLLNSLCLSNLHGRWKVFGECISIFDALICNSLGALS